MAQLTGAIDIMQIDSRMQPLVTQTQNRSYGLDRTGGRDKMAKEGFAGMDRNATDLAPQESLDGLGFGTVVFWCPGTMAIDGAELVG